MSLTGDPDGEPYRAGISVFDVMAGLHATIGVLVGAEPRARDRPGPARRGQPAVLGALRAGQPVQRVRRRRRRTDPDGQQPPEPVPLRAAAVRRRRPDHHRRQQRPVPQAGRGARRPELADDPRFARNEDRTANRDELRPLLAERLRTRTDDGVVPRHHRRRRAVRADQHRRRRRRVRRGGRPRSGGQRRRGSADAMPVGAQPDQVLRDARPTTGCRRRRSTSTARRSAEWLATPPAAVDGGPADRPVRATPDRSAQRDDTPRSTASSSPPPSAPRPPTRSGCSARTSPPT